MTGGVAVVNYYYGYYTTWGQMWADFHGGTGNLGVITPATSAANLALRHPGSFGAAAVINGYFRAADGPAGAALNNSPALEAAAVPRGAAHPEQQPAARLLGRRRHQR
jgi:hypothetical protein